MKVLFVIPLQEAFGMLGLVQREVTVLFDRVHLKNRPVTTLKKSPPIAVNSANATAFKRMVGHRSEPIFMERCHEPCVEVRRFIDDLGECDRR